MIMFTSTLLGLADTKIPSGLIHLVIYSLNNYFACKNKFQNQNVCVGKGKKRNSQQPYNLLSWKVNTLDAWREPFQVWLPGFSCS